MTKDELLLRHWVEIPLEDGRSMLATSVDALSKIGFTIANINALKRDDLALSNNNGWAWSDLDRTVFGWNHINGIVMFRRDKSEWEPVEVAADCKVFPGIQNGKFGSVAGTGLFVLVGSERAYIFRQRSEPHKSNRGRNRR